MNVHLAVPYPNRNSSEYLPSLLFTKYDQLVNTYMRTRGRPESDAKNYFDNRVRDFHERRQVLIVKVSTSVDYDGLLLLMSSQI